MSDGERNEYQAELERLGFVTVGKELAELLSDLGDERYEIGLPPGALDPQPTDPKLLARIWLTCTGNDAHEAERVGEVIGYSDPEGSADIVTRWSLKPPNRWGRKTILANRAISHSLARKLNDLSLQPVFNPHTCENPEGDPERLEVFDDLMEQTKTVYQFSCTQCRLDVRVSGLSRPALFDEVIAQLEPLAEPGQDGEKQWEVPVRILERQNRHP